MDRDNQELRDLFEQWKTLRKNADLPTTKQFLFWFVGTQKRINYTTGDIDALVQEKKKEVKEWAKGVYTKLDDLKKKLEEVKKIFNEDLRAAQAAGLLAQFDAGRHLSSQENEDGPEERRMVVSASANEMKLDPPDASPAGPAPSAMPSNSVCRLVSFNGVVTTHELNYREAWGTVIPRGPPLPKSRSFSSFQ